MQRRLLILSGIEGATVMAVELCGAKLLAPVFGGSLYVWASVLGVTLLALASGYFYGGWLSLRQGNNTIRLRFILVLAPLFVIAMPVFSRFIVPLLSLLPLLTGVVFGTLLLMFGPVFLLGASSPLFIILQSNDSKEAGKISGFVYAVSTLGGIISTFLCGFYLIPEFGLSITLIGFGILLFLSNLIFLRFSNPVIGLLFTALLIFDFKAFSEPSKYLYESDGIMGKVTVRDIHQGNRIIRYLTVNDITQSEMDLNTGVSVSGYIRSIEGLLKNDTLGGRALVLGLGAGLTSNFFTGLNYKVQAVEFDSRIIFAAKSFFGLKRSVEVINEDARRFINYTPLDYDLILVDVFKAEEQPFHIITSESLIQFKKKLRKGSKLIINWHGYLSDKLGEGTRILICTLINSGFKVKICSPDKDEDHRNLLIVASNGELPVLPYEIPFEIKNLSIVNTDDKPVLEKANARANKRWRSLYLNYYHSKTN